ncbi:LysE family transporter [Cellulomonas persica]
MLDASPVLSAAALGVVAGLSVAVPVGPVAVLIVREGLVRGRRAGLAAAAGVASVNLTYAMVAVLLGAQVSRALDGWETWLRVGGAVVLAVVGLVGLARWWRGRSAGVGPGPGRPRPTRPATARCARRGSGRGSSSSRCSTRRPR